MGRARRIGGAALLALVGLTGCPRRRPPPGPAAPPPAGARATAGAPTAGFDDWYPEDISLPAGVEYPCAVTALPRDLAGVPDDEKRYVNHVCAVLIGVVREKQVLLEVLAHGRAGADALTTYLKVSDDALRRLRAEPIPGGLEPFHEHVVTSLELHRTFFEQAVARGAAGATMEQIHAIPEGRTASQRLMGAWGAIEARYGGGWSAEVKDSVYHHLCALDLF